MKTSRGFTLVELALSMVFIGTLSILIALVISNTVQSYQRGVVLNQVNTVGMDLVDDMRSAVQNSSANAATSLCVDFYAEGSDARTRCLEDGAESFVHVTKYGMVQKPNSDADNRDRITVMEVPLYGAFCTGSYTYIWNSGYFFNGTLAEEGYELRNVIESKAARLKYRNASNKSVTVGTAKNPLRLVKVRDDSRSVCVSAMRQMIDTERGKGSGKSVYMPSSTMTDFGRIEGMMPNVFDISSASNDDKGYYYSAVSAAEEPIELLAKDKYNDLVIYGLSTSKPAESMNRNNMFYTVSFILGTVHGGIDIMAKGNSCVPPEGYVREDFNYCAINKFNFAAQASGATTK